jgi:hypothetical protein
MLLRKQDLSTTAIVLLVFALLTFLVLSCEDKTTESETRECNLDFENPLYFESAGQICYWVIAADIVADSNLELVLTNYSSGDVTILLGNDSLDFADSSINYDVGLGPWSILCADFNDDQHGDLAVANDNSGDVSILINGGDGTFAEAVDYQTGVRARSVYGADVNNDDCIDLAVGNNSSDGVSILIGDCLGGFAPAVSYKLGDAVAADSPKGAVKYSVSRTGVGQIGKPGGPRKFQDAASYFAPGEDTWSVCLADFDGDEDKDLAMTDFVLDSVFIIFNDGNGIFADTAYGYPVGQAPRSIVAVDLNGDGFDDLVTANYHSGTASVLMNRHDTSFTITSYGVGTKPTVVFPTDIDNDTDIDLAVVNYVSSSVAILVNNGGGSLSSGCSFYAGQEDIGEAVSVFSADIDFDGFNDLIAANRYPGGVIVLINSAE